MKEIIALMQSNLDFEYPDADCLIELAKELKSLQEKERQERNKKIDERALIARLQGVIS